MPPRLRSRANLALGLWAALSSAYLALLLSNAPAVPSKPFAGISVKSEQSSFVHLPNRVFSCTETERQFQCHTEIQNRRLALSFVKGKDYKYDLSNCQATYDGQPLRCQKGISYFSNLVADSYEIADLKLNLQEIQALRQKFWGLHFLAESSEERLIRIGLVLSILGGIAVWLRSHVNPDLGLFVCLCNGFGVLLLSSYFFTAILLGLGFAD